MFLLPSEAGAAAPIMSYLNFLSGLVVNVSCLGKTKNPGWYYNYVLCTKIFLKVFIVNPDYVNRKLNSLGELIVGNVMD